jgi:hypothetical protein
MWLTLNIEPFVHLFAPFQLTEQLEISQSIVMTTIPPKNQPRWSHNLAQLVRLSENLRKYYTFNSWV